jgi:hypothetical protein
MKEIIFDYDEGEMVCIRADNTQTQYMVIGLIRSNGGNYYRIYNGVDTVLERAGYELQPVPAVSKRIGLRANKEGH